MNKLLRCYAEGRDGEWEAICLEFDIAVQGETFEQVFHDLKEAIHLYVESVLELPVVDQKRLLHRPAPMSLRIKYLWHTLRSTFKSDDDNPKMRADFTAFCPN
jgi:predicted RNase H-like HicB family nuclease